MKSRDKEKYGYKGLRETSVNTIWVKCMKYIKNE